MQKIIFWFRQDLRTFDNRGLIRAIAQKKEIIPIFILDKNIIKNFGGLEDKKFGFLREALESLDQEIQKIGNTKLNIFYDTPENILPALIKEYEISEVHCNTSYGRYGKQRDKNIQEICFDLGCQFISTKDYLLVEPQEVDQRKVFTPFYKLWQKINKDTQEISPENFVGYNISKGGSAKDFIPIPKHPYFTLDFGKNRFENKCSDDYEEQRNFVDRDGTSKLSVYLRFGIYSVRQIYNKTQHIEHFISELAWREFWQHIDYYFPECKEIAFQENKRHIEWEHDEFLFQRWCEGKTGYPIVDASMKQLLETNWMHGRSRMIVASFLTKDLHIDWKWGEKFFKEHLLDYDENVNYGNWQWSASIGADPKPLRIFNPNLQSEKFDPEAKFIKKYIPELASVEAKFIHDPLKNTLPYLAPIVDHSIEQKIAREKYKNKAL